MHATGVAASLPDGGKKLREARDRFADELMELGGLNLFASFVDLSHN